MVSPEEAREQIRISRERLAEARRKIAAGIEARRIPTRAELFVPGLEALRRRRAEAAVKKRLTVAEQERARVAREFEVEVARVEPRIAAIEQQRLAVEAQRVFQEQVEAGVKRLRAGAGASFARLPTEVKEVARRKFGGERNIVIANTQIAQLRNLGLEPVFVRGRLTGFEDSVKKMSVNLENLPLIRPEILPVLQRLGFIESIEVPQIDISQIAFKDIITGEKISALKAPTPLFKPIVIDERGREIRDASIFEQASLGLLPEIKEETLLEKFKERPFKTIPEVTGKISRVAEEIAPSDLISIPKELFGKELAREERLLRAELGGQVAPFFIPLVGASLLIGTGLERVITKGGVAELRQLGAKLEEFGLPKEFAVALPAAEIIGGTALLSIGISTLSKLKNIQKGVVKPQVAILRTSQRNKLKVALFDNLDDNARAFLTKNKLTSTRGYEVTAGDRTIRFLEFGKAAGVKDVFSGMRRFYAIEIDKAGKFKSIIGGMTIEKTAGSGTDAITKLLRISKVKKYFIPKTKKELITLAEKTKTEILARQKGITLTEARAEVRLVERKEVKTIGQLFLEKEKSKKAIQEAFAKAKEIGRAETLTLTVGKKGKLTLEQLEGKVFGRIVTKDIRTSEIGKQIFTPTRSIVKLGRPKPKFNQENILKLLKEQGVKITGKLKNLISKGIKTKQITKLEDVQISRIVPTGIPATLAQIIIAEQQSIIVSTKALPTVITGIGVGIIKVIPPPITKPIIKVTPIPLVVTKIKPALITTPKVKEKLKMGLLAKSESKLIQPVSLAQISRVGLVQKTILGLQPKLRVGLTQRQLLRQKLIPKLIQRQRPITRPTTLARLRFPTFPPPFVPPDVVAARERRARARALAKRKPKVAYFPLIKEFGKFKKLTKHPLPFKQARSLARFTVDRTLSAQHKLQKIINPKKVIRIRTPKVDEKKFRDYKIRKDKRIPLEDFGEIERRKHRLDTKHETQTIQQFKRRKAFKGLFKIKRKKRR